jgi:hypothetical protein
MARRIGRTEAKVRIVGPEGQCDETRAVLSRTALGVVGSVQPIPLGHTLRPARESVTATSGISEHGDDEQET